MTTIGSHQVLAALADVEADVRQAVAARRAGDPAPDDPYRGLYLTPDTVDRILAGRPAEGGPGGGPVLDELAERFELTPLDVRLLLLALAPEVDPRFERLYAYLNDDVTRRRATVGLALELCRLPVAGAGRFRLAADAPLVAGGLIEVLDDDRPALSRALRVPDRVVAHLLGHDRVDPLLAGVCRLVPSAPPSEAASEAAARLGAGVEAGVRLLYLRGRDSETGRLAESVLAAAGRPALVVGRELAGEQVATLVREAWLRGAGIVLGPAEVLGERRSALLRDVVDRTARVPVIVFGQCGWDPLWGNRTPVTAEVGIVGGHGAEWARALAEATGGAACPVEVGAFRLGPEQIRRAATVAAHHALLNRRPVRVEDVRAGVLAQNAAGLERLARRVVPAVGWDDLVLPEPVRGRLSEVAARARHRDRVLGTWGMRPGGGRGRGVTALFAGESGTGKTMACEVIAADLGMDLYVVDLSTVVDKYVGETEKNLDRVFTEAATTYGVLLFDEADAIFGKRTEVRDSHDRYANLESAFLLQRMESFDGIAALTTNLRANLDEAFTRRLDAIIDFPMPDTGQRRSLWDRCLGPALPRSSDVDLEFCAERFELTGGSIRACAVTAAYRAAAAGAPVTMADLIAAVQQEYRKLGRLLLDSEFAPYG